jgi:uncharacterized membrane protein YbhN (UPF0104 family)
MSATAGHRGLLRRLMPVLVSAGVALLAFLLYRALSHYSLEKIVSSAAAIPAERLLFAGGFAAASYICLTWNDWLALRCVGRPLPYRKAALASFVSLSIGHNVGVAALSSGAIRYRFYSRWGLRGGEVAQVVVYCGITIALGLITLGGMALLLRPTLAGEITGLGPTAVLAVGGLCIVLNLGYVTLASLVHRPVRVWRWCLRLPPLRLALGQIAVGSVNYALVSACLHQVLSGLAEISYFPVAAAYVIASVAALISHVPGGLGVIEGVVLFLLPGSGLLGAVVMFRVIYFLVPLCLGGPTFLVAEMVLRRRRRQAA